MIETWVEATIGAIATIAVGILALVQWRISEKNGALQREAEMKARERQRDAELTDWGMRAIALMAELEAYCAPIRSDATFDALIAEQLGYRASALVDQGRLFFPNVEVPNTERGYRVKLLDEVLRACYVAQYLAKHGQQEGDLLRAQVWSARTRFVRLLQVEVRKTLHEVGPQHAGDSISYDPRHWPEPEFRPRVAAP